MIAIALKSGEVMKYPDPSGMDLDKPYFVHLYVEVGDTIERHYIPKNDVQFIKDVRK